MLRVDAQQTAGLTEFVCQDKTSKKHNELLFHAWVSTQYSVKAQCRVLLDLIVSLDLIRSLLDPFFSKTRCVRCCALLCDAGCPSFSQAPRLYFPEILWNLGKGRQGKKCGMPPILSVQI